MYAFNLALTAFRSESYIGSATALPDTVLKFLESFLAVNSFGDLLALILSILLRKGGYLIFSLPSLHMMGGPMYNPH